MEIKEKGYHIIEDEDIGDRVARLLRNGFSQQTAAALRLCKEEILDNDVGLVKQKVTRRRPSLIVVRITGPSSRGLLRTQR